MVTVSNKHQNGQKFCVGPRMTAREGLWILKITKIFVQSFFYRKILKKHEQIL